MGVLDMVNPLRTFQLTTNLLNYAVAFSPLVLVLPVVLIPVVLATFTIPTARFIPYDLRIPECVQAEQALHKTPYFSSSCINPESRTV